MKAGAEPAFVVCGDCVMELEISCSGDVVERQELLNGTKTITIEGASDDGAWTLTGVISWNRGLVDFAGEGDVALIRGDDEVLATLVRAEALTPEGDDASDHLLKIEYEVDEGSGAYSGAAGTGRAEVRIAGDEFTGRWALTLDL
jgi:hypothetical protein